MNAQDTIQLVGTVAWPLTVLLVALLFRHELRSVVKRLSHLKFRDLEATFEKQLEAVEAKVTELPRADHGVIAVAGATPKEPLPETSAISARATILESWIAVKQAIQSLADRAAIIETGRRNTHKLLGDLQRREMVSKNTREMLDALRTMRNEAAHTGALDLSKKEAERYRSVAAELVEHLESIEMPGSS